MDIVSKLADWPHEDECKKHGVSFNYIEPICRTAATEITRLREENKRMRDALTYFADRPTVSELMEGKHDPMPDTVAARIEEMGRRKREHDDAILKARTALATTGGE